MSIALPGGPVRVVIAGTGSCLGDAVLSSSELDTRFSKTAGWFEARTGIASRPVCHNSDQVAMAVAASRRALADAGVEAAQIGLMLFAASVSYQPIPATAPLVQRGLGIEDGACCAFDVNATCLGFLAACDVASSFIGSGRCRHAIVVASEVASRALPWEGDPETAALFGDGAAAAVLSPSRDESGFVAFRIETRPSGWEDCQLASGGTRHDFRRDREAFEAVSLFRMDGKALYRHTAEHFDGFVGRLLAGAGWAREEIDIVVPHQASALALRHLSARCGFAPEKVVDLISNSGNQVAASLPGALDHARRTGLLKLGTKCLMLGTAAGLSFGGAAMVA